jgi:phage/plasmid-associated DNA primase
LSALTLSLFDSLTSTAPRAISSTFPEWAAHLQAHYSRPYPSKDTVPGFAPAEWSPGFGRGLAGIARMHAVVLDIDDAAPLDVERLVAGPLRAYQHIVYSTWSHPEAAARGLCKFRVLLPLARPVSSDEWPALWRRIAYHLGGGVARRVQGARVEGSGLTDGACKDAAHFYYVPSQPPDSGRPPIFHVHLGGALLDPGAVLAWPDAPEDAPAPTVERLLLDAGELTAQGPKRAALGAAFALLARGEAFAEGERDATAWHIACELVRRYPLARVDLLATVFERSRAAMALANPADHLSPEQILGKLARARDAVEEDRRAREAEIIEVTEAFRRVQGWQANEQLPGAAGLLACVLSDGTRLPIGCPEIRDANEVALAYHVLARMGAPCVTAGGATYLYRPDLGVWRPLSTDDLERRVLELEGRPHRGIGGRPGLVRLSQRTLGAVVRVVRQATSAGAAWFLSGAPGVAFADGFVGADLALRPHDPCNRALHRVEGPFDPNATAPVWSNTVRDILAVVDEPVYLDEVERSPEAETEDKVRALEEWIGAALLGAATRLHRALVLVGNPGTGKSTLGSAIAALWAPEVTCGVQPPRFSDPVWAAELAGMGLNYLGEADAGMVRDPSHIKAAITGDEIMGAPKYEKPFKFRPRAAQLWCYNVLPIYLDDSSAIAVRMLVLRCEQTFRDTSRDDVTRGQRLAEETAQIASRCLVAGARALRRGRHELPASARAEIAAWSESSNPVREWLSAHTSPCAPGDGATLDELHFAYRTWVEGLGRDRSVPTPQGLGQRLRSMGYRQSRRQNGLQRTMRWSVQIKTSAASAAIAATVRPAVRP